jgi:hypothetical protein
MSVNEATFSVYRETYDIFTVKNVLAMPVH